MKDHRHASTSHRPGCRPPQFWDAGDCQASSSLQSVAVLLPQTLPILMQNANRIRGVKKMNAGYPHSRNRVLTSPRHIMKRLHGPFRHPTLEIGTLRQYGGTQTGTCCTAAVSVSAGGLSSPGGSSEHATQASCLTGCPSRTRGKRHFMRCSRPQDVNVFSCASKKPPKKALSCPSAVCPKYWPQHGLTARTPKHAFALELVTCS